MNTKLALIALGVIAAMLSVLLSALGVATHYLLSCSPADGLCVAAVAAWEGKEGWLAVSLSVAAFGSAWFFREAKSQNAPCNSGMI